MFDDMTNPASFCAARLEFLSEVLGIIHLTYAFKYRLHFEISCNWHMNGSVYSCAETFYSVTLGESLKPYKSRHNFFILHSYLHPSNLLR
jgi:hypothetical protein